MPGAEIVFVGSHVGMEKNIIPQTGYPLELTRARGFERGFSTETLEAVKGIFDSFTDVRKLLKKHKPDLVIGTGGFTSAMLLFCAACRHIPTLIHEQNAYPGRSNRLTGRVVDRVAISFPEAAPYFDGKKVFIAGNPVRDAFKHVDREAAREKLGIKPEQKLVIFMGGSQGAESVNEAALYVMREKAGDEDVVFYHLTGKDLYDSIRQALEGACGGIPKNVHLVDYCNDVATLLSAGDLVVSRSGAMSVAEIAACGIPSILVPYPMAAGDHQTYNAKSLSAKGAAVLIADSDLTGAGLLKEIEAILSDPARSRSMREAADAQKHLDADRIIGAAAERLLREKHGG